MKLRDVAHRVAARAARTARPAATLAGLLALTPSLAGAAPSILVDPVEIDLGVIEAGVTYERFIEVTNAGDGVLVLTDIKTSCGCTAVAVDGVVELAAGAKQKLQVTFDSKNMDGVVKKNVKITSNDPEQSTISVPLTANVHRPVRWEPKYVALNNVQVNQPFEQVVQLQTDRHLAAQVTDAYILGGRLRNQPTKLFDLEPRPARSEGERDIHEFLVRLRPGAKPQRIAETLHVITTLPAPNDTMNLPVRGEVRGRIRIVPNFVVFPMVEPGQEARRDLTLTASEGTFQVIRAEVADGPVKTEIIPADTGQQTVVRLSYVGQDEAVDERRTLTIETDDPDQPIIEMRVRYQTRLPDDGQAQGAASPATTAQSKAAGPE